VPPGRAPARKIKVTFLSKWMSLSLRAKGLIVSTLSAAALLVAAGVAYSIAISATDDEVWVSHALQAGEQIQNMRASATDASAQIRAYWITGDEAFAGAVRQDLAVFDSAMQKLVQLTQDNAGQRQRLTQIAAIERSRVERIFDALGRFRSGVLSGPELRRSLLAGEDERLRLENLISAMEQEEKQLLAAHLARLGRLRVLATAGSWQILGIAAGSILLMWILFAYGISHRIRVLKDGLAAIGSGQFVDPGASDQLKAVCESLVRTTESLHQKNLVLENALHGIAQAGSSGRYLSFNRAYAEILGISKHEPVTNVFASVHGDDWEKLEEALLRMRSEGRAETQARIVRPDGSVLEAVLTVLPISGEQQEGYYVFLRDNSVQKSAEAALVRAKDTAVAANLAKTSFLAKIGHEIRTPLNAILGSADLLAATSLTCDQAEYVEIFQRNSRRLVALINDFLDFSRIEAGAVRVDRVPFPVRQTIYDVVETFRETAGRKGLSLQARIDPDVPAWQLGDGHRVQQVLINLVSNAVKFTPAGHVEIRAFVAAGPDHPRLRFEVADTGPGIRAADRERIFAPFTQLKDSGATAQGSGLGLTICRELVELMDGSIGMLSEAGLGSTFYFDLRLEEAAPPVAVPPGSKSVERLHVSAANHPLRILIAEDGADNRLLLQAYLKNQPLVIRFAENGQEVIDALENGAVFDLILMDLDMPLVDGYTATRWVRAWEAKHEVAPTPIVALSAHAIHETVRASLDAGCVAHVSKPVDRRTLLETITRYARSAARRSSEAGPQCVSPEVAALVPKYLASQSRQIDEARARLGQRDFDSIRRFGHNLKGTGRGYGFAEMEQMGRELERAAEEISEAGIAATLEALRRFVNDATIQADDTIQVA